MAAGGNYFECGCAQQYRFQFGRVYIRQDFASDYGDMGMAAKQAFNRFFLSV